MTTRVLNRGKGNSPEPFDPNNPDHVFIRRADRFRRWEASKWANPFVVCKQADTRAQAAALFAQWLAGRDFPDVPAAKSERRAWMLANVHILRGKTLFCWCKPDVCHGDVLAELAEGNVRQDGPAARQ